MPAEEVENLYDFAVLMLMLSIPFVLAGLWVLYRLVRGHRWRQSEILHTNIEILQTNQAILSALLSAIPKERRPRKAPVPRASKHREDASGKPLGKRKAERPSETPKP